MENFTPGFETVKSPEQKEFGANVEIALKFIRHGDRSRDNYLTDKGRQVTREMAAASGVSPEDFDAFKAVGSTVGPYNDEGMGRAEETAHIYVNEVAGDKASNTRKSEVYSYQSLVTPPPYDHKAVYEAALPDNFDSLSPEEKTQAAVKAQEAVVQHVLSLDSEEAENYKREWAGSFSYAILHYHDMAHRLKSGSKVMMLAGGHGTGELLLQKALIRRTEEGEVVRGFSDLKEIGGQINTSEAFTVDIATDDKGEDKPLVLMFDNPDRPVQDMELDAAVVRDLAQYYESLHPDLRGMREIKG